MFCMNCGASLPDGSAFCPNCGSPAEQPQNDNSTAYQQPVSSVQYNSGAANQASEVQDSLAKSILVFGILSLALSQFGIVGLIFAIITKSKLGRYIPQYGSPTGKAKVGKILSTVGLIASIVYAVVWTVYIILAIAAILNLAAY